MAKNNLIDAKNTDYSKIMDDIIKKNKELSNSLKVTKKEIDAQNKSFENLSKSMKTYLTSVQQINKNMGGRNINPSNSRNRQNLLNNFVNNYQTQQNNRTNVLNTGSPVNTPSGRNNLLSITQNAISSFRLGSQVGGQGVSALANPGTTKALGALGTAGASIAVLGALVVIFTKMVKAGESAYKTQLNMAQSLKKLGEGSKYATTYAKQLNEELGVSMSKTLAQLSDFSQQLQAQGFSSAYAGKFAVNVSQMADIYSKKMGTSFTETQKLFTEAINGSESALISLFSTSSSAFSGWLMETKGINMAMVQLSPGRLSQEYAEFLNFLTSNMQGLGDSTTTTARRIEEVMNKLADIGEKLKVIFLPLFEAIVSGVSSVVDFIFDAVNNIRKFFGAEPLVLDIETPTMFDKGMEKQLKDWTKLGEQIDAAKGKLYSFDEVESQTGLLQANEENEIDSTDLNESLGIDNELMEQQMVFNVDVQDMSLDEFKQHIKDMPKVQAIMEIGNKEQWDYVWDTLTTSEKMSKEGFLMTFQAAKIGDAWGVIEGLVFGVGGAFKGLSDIQYFFQTTLINLIFSVGQAITTKLEEIFPKLDGLTEKLEKIKNWFLDIFGINHDIKVNITETTTSAVGNFVGSVGDYFKTTKENRMIYDNGGIAIKPQIAQIGTPKGELAIPLGTTAAEKYYDSMANSITNKLPQQNQTPISQDTYNINLGKDGTFFGSRSEFMKLTEMIADNLQQLQKQRGVLNYGTI